MAEHPGQPGVPAPRAGTTITRASRTGPCRRCGYWVWPRGAGSIGGRWHDLGARSWQDAEPLRVAEHTRCPIDGDVVAGDARDPICLRREGAYRLGEVHLVTWTTAAIDAIFAGIPEPVDHWSSYPHVGYREDATLLGGGRVLYSAAAVSVATYTTQHRPIRDFSVLRPATAEEAAPLLASRAELDRLRQLCQRAETELRDVMANPATEVTRPPSLTDPGFAAFFTRLRALPGVRVPDSVAPTQSDGRWHLLIYLDDERQQLWVNQLPQQRTAGLTLTAARRDLFALLASAFPAAETTRR